METISEHLMRKGTGSKKEKYLVFLIEDEESIAQTISIQLQLVGFTVRHAASAQTAAESSELKKSDVIILDWMLPDTDGPEFIDFIREITDVPILMLTARSEMVDKLYGLEAGADDYLTKPFDMLELIARLKALIRRHEMDLSREDTVNKLVAGKLCFNFETRELKIDGKSIKLTPTELRLFEVLAGTPGKLYTREELIMEVMGYEFEGYGRSLDSHIARIRSKIETDPKSPEYIVTVFGVGYKFGYFS
jgi:DNA-binding response OmpR family regulator